jgi:hypothetical protein
LWKNQIGKDSIQRIGGGAMQVLNFEDTIVSYILVVTWSV